MDDIEGRVIARLREVGALGSLVGEAPAFRRAIAVLPAAARSDATVLLRGETGTGKELVARALHYLSPRAGGPFVAVNCGMLGEALLEDELCGHARGAFTDARHPRPGLLAEASRGTLLLDEIDALAPRGQVALLRLLQDRRFRPVGSDQEREADVRFVAVTNAPLEDLMRSGRFRADLYYRLCVFSIELPPLRERRDDILPLAAHFLRKHVPAGAPVPALSPPAREALLQASWPGNVRELENAIVRAVHVGGGATIDVGDLGLGPPGPPGAGEPPARPLARPYRVLRQEALDAFQREYLRRLMCECAGNVSRAARLSGKERRDLGRLLKKHGLDARAFAPSGGDAVGADAPGPV